MTWRLLPPSANLVLWRKPKNPPSVVACALDPGVDATAAARPELQSRLPFTAVHRTVHRPQHLHGSSPSTLDARVPATKDQAHDHTAWLTIHSSQPGESTPHSSVGECLGLSWLISSHIILFILPTEYYLLDQPNSLYLYLGHCFV